MPQFYPSKTQKWATLPYGLFNALQVGWRCPLHPDSDISKHLNHIPDGASILIVSNHADEMDIRVFMEAARHCKKQFRFMVNQEAFEEMHGFAGFWMQRVGCFSVARGTSDAAAKAFAIQTLKKGQHPLVMYPEGEIYYSNDEIKPFKTGAVFLAFEALKEMRLDNIGADVYVLPVGIKYTYKKSIRQKLHTRLKALEKQMGVSPKTQAITERLSDLMNRALKRYQLEKAVSDLNSRWTKLGEDIGQWQTQLMTQLEEKYTALWQGPSRKLIDRAHHLSSKIKDKINNRPRPKGPLRRALQRDLDTLKRTVWLAGWAPQYHEAKPTTERLAETVMKLDREIGRKQRPKPLGRRHALIRAAPAIPLSTLMKSYDADSRSTCRQLSDYLRQTIQLLVEQKIPSTPIPKIILEQKQRMAVNLHVTAADNQKVFLDHYKNGHRKAVIIAHGFFNSKSAVLLKDLAASLSNDYDVAVLDFRGHGQSPGYFYWTTKEYLDLEAVIDYLSDDYDAIGLIGFSLGAATSIITASKSDVIKSVIAVSPPTEFSKIEYHFWKLEPEQDIFYNLVGEGRYGKGVRPGPFWLKKDKPIHCIRNVKAPILFIHGTKDWLIEPHHAEELYQAASAKKALKLIEGGPHAEYLLRQNKSETLGAIMNWLKETL